MLGLPLQKVNRRDFVPLHAVSSLHVLTAVAPSGFWNFEILVSNRPAEYVFTSVRSRFTNAPSSSTTTQSGTEMSELVLRIQTRTGTRISIAVEQILRNPRDDDLQWLESYTKLTELEVENYLRAIPAQKHRDLLRWVNGSQHASS